MIINMVYLDQSTSLAIINSQFTSDNTSAFIYYANFALTEHGFRTRRARVSV